MPQFILKIDLGNDAMQKKKDIAYALFGVAGKLNEGMSSKDQIRDINGNIVGHYEVTE